MSDVIWVRWDMTDDYDEGFEEPYTDGMETMLGSWADCASNGESAASDIVKDYFDNGEWANRYGDSTYSANILLRVYAPDSIAGLYRVSVERKFSAQSTRLAGDVADDR